MVPFQSIKINIQWKEEVFVLPLRVDFAYLFSVIYDGLSLTLFYLFLLSEYGINTPLCNFRAIHSCVFIHQVFSDFGIFTFETKQKEIQASNMCSQALM